MATIPFDTHTFVKQLRASGVPTDQAEAHATALVTAMDNEMATKTEMKELHADMKTRFAEVRGHFALLRWMLGFVLAGVVAIGVGMFQ